MNLPQAVLSAFKNYTTFTGRAARSEFWYWVLFWILAAWVLNILDIAIFGAATIARNGLYPLYSIFTIIAFLPSLAVTVRRLHDVDRSGWWIFILLIPIAGFLVLLYWYCSKGTPGMNRFGPEPARG